MLVTNFVVCLLRNDEWLQPDRFSLRSAGVWGLALARHDPKNGRDFEEQKYLWLAEALEKLPVAIGLIDANGRFIALNGTMRDIFGDVIPSRDAEQIKKWRVFDDEGNVLDPSRWPSERTLRGGHAMNCANAIYLPDTDQQRRLRLFSTPFVDANGQSAGLVLMQDVELERRALEHNFERMQQRFIDTLVMTIRQAAHTDKDAATAQQSIVKAMGFAVSDKGKGVDSLSPREEEVLRLMAWGNSRKQIGAQLGIAVKTVEFHRGSAARKLELKDRVDVVRYAIDRGWLTNGTPPTGERPGKFAANPGECPGSFADATCIGSDSSGGRFGARRWKTSKQKRRRPEEKACGSKARSRRAEEPQGHHAGVRIRRRRAGLAA